MSAVDTSKEAIARRMRRREFDLQDRALALSEAGMSNRDLGREFGIETKRAIRLRDVASQRRAELAKAVPHADPASLELTAPETKLLRSLTEVHFEQWRQRETCSPDTGWVGRRIGHSKQWAVSCARRRIIADPSKPQSEWPGDAEKPSLVQCSGNGYIYLTHIGWSVAAALFPDLFEA